MKTLHPIYRSPEEQSAINLGELSKLSQSTIRQLAELMKGINQLADEYPTLHQELITIATEVSKNNDQTKIINKLEEVKSAGLVANRLLKDIRETIKDKGITVSERNVTVTLTIE